MSIPAPNDSTDPNRRTNRFVSVFNGKGKLLANGACIDDGYTNDVVPQKGITKVYSEITSHIVRSVDSKEGTMTLEFTIKMTWQDPHITTKFTNQDITNGGIVLSNRAIKNIWTPDFYILNRKSLYTTDNWDFLRSEISDPA